MLFYNDTIIKIVWRHGRKENNMFEYVTKAEYKPVKMELQKIICKVVAYMKNVALRVAAYGATANSLSPGGVKTALNEHVMSDPVLWEKIMNETLLPKWAESEEIAEWAYFMTVINRSMTAQDILVDNGEEAKSNFIW